MQDRPDLLLSEMQGCSFDALQQVFPKQLVKVMFELEPLPEEVNTTIFVVVDPAAGGPQSDYAVVSMIRTRGNVTVSYVMRARRAPRTHQQTRVHSLFR